MEVSRAVRALPPPPRLVDALLDALALMVTDGPAPAAPVLRQAISFLASADVPVEEGLRWGWMVRLFLSPRTVQYHLGKVFAKLGITSRAQFSRALSDS